MLSVSRRIPKYRLHKASGRAVVTLNGRDYFLGRFGTPESREKYDRLVAEWLAHGRMVPETGRPDITINELILRFWRHVESFYRRHDGTPTSEQDHFRPTLRVLKSLYGSTPAGGFGPRALRAIVQKMIDLGWSRPYINSQAGRIKRVFKWAASQELVPSQIHVALSTVTGLRRGKSEAPDPDPVRPVCESYVEQTKMHLPPLIQDMIDVQLMSGMRSGELVIMRGVDIDTSGAIWTYRPQHHKTAHHGHARTIWLGPKAQEIVKKYLKPDLRAFLFSPRDAQAWRNAQAKTHRRPRQKPTPRTTERELGDRYDEPSYRRAISYACEKAFPVPDDLKQPRKDAKDEAERIKAVKVWRKEHHWHPHQLRHNAATRLRRDFGIEAARIILGHKSAGITEIYAEADVQKAAKIMGEVG